jgi:hypothetical protein
MSRYIPKFLKEFYDDYQNVKLQLQETNFAMQILRQKCEESRSQCNNAYTDIKSEYELTRQHNCELQRTVDILREEVGILNQENDEIRGNLAAISQKLDSAAAVTDRVSCSEDRLTVLTKSEETMTRQLAEMHEKYLQVQTDARIMRDQLAETRENVIADTSRAVANLEEELDVLRDRFEFDTPNRRLDYYIDCLEKGKNLKSIVFKPYVMFKVIDQNGNMRCRNENISNEKFDRFLDLLQTNQSIETFIIQNDILMNRFYDINRLRKLNNFISQSRTIKNLQLFNIFENASSQPDWILFFNYFQEFLITIFRNESIINLYITPNANHRSCISLEPNTLDIFNRNTTLKMIALPVNCNDFNEICIRKGIQLTIN